VGGVPRVPSAGGRGPRQGREGRGAGRRGTARRAAPGAGDATGRSKCSHSSSQEGQQPTASRREGQEGQQGSSRASRSRSRSRRKSRSGINRNRSRGRSSRNWTRSRRKRTNSSNHNNSTHNSSSTHSSSTNRSRSISRRERRGSPSLRHPFPGPQGRGIRRRRTGDDPGAERGVGGRGGLGGTRAPGRCPHVRAHVPPRDRTPHDLRWHPGGVHCVSTSDSIQYCTSAFPCCSWSYSTVLQSSALLLWLVPLGLVQVHGADAYSIMPCTVFVSSRGDFTRSPWRSPWARPGLGAP